MTTFYVTHLLLSILLLTPSPSLENPIPFSNRQSTPSVAPFVSPSACPIRLPQHPPTFRVLTPRIVGGAPASTKTASYLASLHISSRFTCSGTLLSSRWVLSAAHCVTRTANISVFLTGRSAFAGVRVRVAKVFTPRQTNDTFPAFFPRDVALLKLASDAPKNAVFALINADEAIPLQRSFARAVGFGKAGTLEPNRNHRLRQVDMPIVPWDQCQFVYPTVLTTDRLCAGYTLGKCNACHGDSGGPLLQFDSNGSPVVIGITSSGSYVCAEPNYPVIYMRVSSYIKWFDEVGAQYTIAVSVDQIMDTSSPVPPRPSLPPLPTPVQTACPVKIPHHLPTSEILRIVGGLPSRNVTAEYIVAFYSPAGFRCTGVLISKRWIITVAHCQVDLSYSVKLNGLDLSSGTRGVIEKVYTPSRSNSQYAIFDVTSETNYAAILLKEDAPSSNFVLLNGNESVPDNFSYARVVGYGDISYNGWNPDGRLRQVDIPIFPLNECRTIHPEISSSEAWICAGYRQGGCGTCQGDGGGPLLQFDELGRPVVIGLTVFGSGCGWKMQPGVYIKVSSFFDYLERIGAEFNTTGEAVQIIDSPPDDTEGDRSIPVNIIAVSLTVGAIILIVFVYVACCCVRCGKRGR